jgi:hypothetical protein
MESRRSVKKPVPWLRHPRSLALLGIIVLLAACSPRSSTKGKIVGADAPPGAVPSIVGSYSVNGVDPIGTEYGGNLTIKPGAAPDEYQLQWIVTGSIQEGSGRLDGSRLHVQWRTVEGIRPASGVATYTVTTRRELYGDRAIAGFPKIGTENAFPNPDPKDR